MDSENSASQGAGTGVHLFSKAIARAGLLGLEPAPTGVGCVHSRFYAGQELRGQTTSGNSGSY